VIELAGHFAAGRLSTEALLTAPDEDVLAALTAVRGIGKWTVDMFLIFTLRRGDVLPVGDLGVQKGLLRWVLAAHGALPPPKLSSTPRKSLPATPSKTPGEPAEPQSPTALTHTTSVGAMEPPATPVTPNKRSLEAASSSATLLNEPATPTPANGPAGSSILPATPAPPPVTPSASTNPSLPPAEDDSLIAVTPDWSSEHALKAAPLPPGLDISTLRSRLAGKKAK
jgi:DNA-3-methyladenine glycosylase II